MRTGLLRERARVACAHKGAENRRAPVILSLAESHFDYFDFELLMTAVEGDVS